MRKPCKQIAPNSAYDLLHAMQQITVTGQGLGEQIASVGCSIK